MPRPGHGSGHHPSGGGEPPENSGARSHRSHGTHSTGAGFDAEVAATTQRAVDGRANARKKSKRGQPQNNPNVQHRTGPRPVPEQLDPNVTHPTAQPGGSPTGAKATIHPSDNDVKRRSLTRENIVAQDLADRGYEVHQRPLEDEVARARAATGDHGNPKKDPDYLIEGRVFDCYSPESETKVRSIWTVVEDKIATEQTQRVVVDLQEWKGSMPDVRKQFDDWPIDNLKEVKFIKPDGTIEQFYPID